MKKLLSFGLLLSVLTKAGNRSIDDLWAQMQNEYQSLYHKFCPKALSEKETFYHPCWEQNTREIQQLIMGPPTTNFLYCSAIERTMVRQHFEVGQYQEICFLKHCVKPEISRLIGKYKESPIGNIPIECAEYNCTINSLGQLYYAARILEKAKAPNAIETIVEIGGGFGNLAYIFKNLLPAATIVIFDLPELLSIQWLYLTSSLPGTDIYIHHDASTKSLKKKGIHLIPIFLLPEINVNADVFVSNFALSESTAPIQQNIVDNNYFNAPICYITGQLHGWRDGFVNQKLILASTRALFKTVDCLPFHLFTPKIGESYELIATR